MAKLPKMNEKNPAQGEELTLKESLKLLYPAVTSPIRKTYNWDEDSLLSTYSLTFGYMMGKGYIKQLMKEDDFLNNQIERILKHLYPKQNKKE